MPSFFLQSCRKFAREFSGQKFEQVRNQAIQLREMACRLHELADEIEATRGSPAPVTEAKPISAVPMATLARLARSISQERLARSRYLDRSLFAEAGWNIMLELFVRSAAGDVVRVSNACEASGVPATTALRWIRVLENEELVERQLDAGDHRATILFLTSKGKRAMSGYLSTVMHRRFGNDPRAESIFRPTLSLSA